jgi:hypothetical protein
MQGVPAAFFLALGPWRGGLAGLWDGQSLGYAVVDAGFAALLARTGVSLYDSTFSRTVWMLYGGAKGLVMRYRLARARGYGPGPPGAVKRP